MGVRGDVAVAAVALAVAAAAAVVDAAAAAAAATTTTTTTFTTPGNETAAYDRNCRIHSKWLLVPSAAHEDTTTAPNLQMGI